MAWHHEWNGYDPKSVFHKTGHQNGDTWSVKKGDEPGTMQFGPYVPLEGGAGTYEAFWELRLDESCPTKEKVGELTVYDRDKSLILGDRDVPATDWGGRVNEFIQLSVSFLPQRSDLGDKYEFRTHWSGKCTLTLRQLGVRRK